MLAPVTQITAFTRSIIDDSEIRIIAKSSTNPWQELCDNGNIDVFSIKRVLPRFYDSSTRRVIKIKFPSISMRAFRAAAR